MTVQLLISALWTEAELKERELLDEAQERVAQITASRDETIARLNGRIENRKKHIADETMALASSSARMGKRRMELLAIDRGMRIVRDATEALFRDFMRSADYAEHILREVDSITKEAGEISQIRADEVTAAALISSGVPNVITDHELSDGFIATLVDGKTRVFALFSTKYEKLWRAVAPQFVAILSEAMPHGD